MSIPRHHLEELAKELDVAVGDICSECAEVIVVQIYKGSGVCSENCRKDRDNDHEPFKAVNLKIHEDEDK